MYGVGIDVLELGIGEGDEGRAEEKLGMHFGSGVRAGTDACKSSEKRMNEGNMHLMLDKETNDG